jgi:ribosomal protein S18 acetylase RimI-like enzyme
MIRKAIINDCPRMAEIHIFGWRCAYTVNIHTEKFIELLNNEIGNKDNTYVYENDTIIKGFMTTGDCRDDGKLEGIYVDPIFQRQHRGTELVKNCIEEAKSKNKFEKNKRSISFYEKMYFRKGNKT